jgi:hypothetical protein
MVNIIVLFSYGNLLFISFPIFYLATTRSSKSAKGNINRDVIIPDNVIHRNKSATVSADAIGDVNHGKKKGKDLETNLEAAGATTSSRVLRPRHVMRQTDLAPSGKFHFYFLYFAIYSDYHRFRLLLQLTFYFISYILFSDDAFQ